MTINKPLFIYCNSNIIPAVVFHLFQPWDIHTPLQQHLEECSSTHFILQLQCMVKIGIYHFHTFTNYPIFQSHTLIILLTSTMLYMNFTKSESFPFINILKNTLLRQKNNNSDDCGDKYLKIRISSDDKS